MIKNKSFKLLSHLFFTFILITTTICEYRSINGEGNNVANSSTSIPNTPFVRIVPSTSRFADGNASMIPTPGNYLLAPEASLNSCSANLPDGVFPLPRCVSNKLMSKQSKDDDIYDLSRLEKFKSKRKTSHILTYWGLFLKMDISSGYDTGTAYPKGIYIPQDDQLYLSSHKNGPKPSNFTFAATTFLPFNRSLPDGGYTGIDEATPFVDMSIVYGRSNNDLQVIRDYNNNGKMRLIKDPSTLDGAFGYPPVDGNGDYIYGYSAEFGRNVFTDFFHILFLREHNRLCDELFAVHGNDWNDETYFQEARRWVIAFVQKITYYEYLGTILGTPLPKYDGYKSDLTPSIDTFFATVTYRYGHSEVSDFYNIVNNEGEPLATLSLNDIENSRLIKTYGAPLIALSLALQRQEEIDIYVDDFVRYYLHKSTYLDISSVDTVRSRDHGIPSYNDARVAFGLTRKTTWADISSDPDVQKRLQDTYATIDRVEALVGGLAEDHVYGGNLGELFYKSFSDQWIKIRASDRFWYENQDAGFSKEDIAKIQDTTLLDIIKRNTPESYYPENLWFVQPATSPKLSENVNGYNSPLSLSNAYTIQWKIDSTNITFLITMSSTNAWFGLGFNPNPNGNAMTDTDMMIFRNINQSVIGKNHKGLGLGIVPAQLGDDDQIITILNQKVEGGVTKLEVTRPIDAKNRKSIDGTITMVYAWNPTSNTLTYHGGNRGTRVINFRTGASSDNGDNRPRLLRMHGIVMFIIWGVLFPGSVWIVRYLRHIDTYMVQHRNLNLFGGMIVGIFAAVALTATTTHAASPHAIMGIIISSITVIQISLGILAIWSLANVESAATGIVRYLKHSHFYLGTLLLLAAWVNVFLGMITYDQKFGGNNGAHKAYIWAYTAWLLLFGFVITASEFYYKIKNMQFLWPVKKSDDLARRLRNCIPDDVYEKLPPITWDEFNKRVMTGANLVVAEGLIFDIHKWIPLHPGGQKILQRVIGTDITNDFFFDPTTKTVIQNDNDNYDVKDTSISILTNDTYKENPNNAKKRRPYSVANAVDMINATAFKNRRVAMHRHSKFATSKLASMVVARILDSEDNSNTNDFEPSQQTKNIDELKVSQQQPSSDSPYIFRRYILTNIEVVTRPSAENAVKKLTFQVIHPNDKLPKFLPGDYIEIMSYTNNHVIIRPYTPLQGPTKNSFCIFVKIYKDGVMSQHLNKQLRNFEVKVRGPFDIADRMTPTPSRPSLDSNSIITRPSSANSQSINRTFSEIYRRYDNNNKENLNNNFDLNDILDNRSGILLNKGREDLCWDCLFMVCGGAGITPMLQLIQYHIDKAASSNPNFMLYLLAAYDRIDDLIYPKYLDYLQQTLKGKLEIRYILFKPPTVWRGYSGLIDETLLYDWISERYSIPPQVPPKFSNYGIGGIQNSQVNNNPNAYNYYPNQNNNYYPNQSNNNYYPNQSNNNYHSNQNNNNYPVQEEVEEYNEQIYDPYYNQRSSINGINRITPIQIPISNNLVYQSEQQMIYQVSSAPSSISPHSSSSNIPSHATNQIILMNERHNYMNLFARDNSKQVKLIVCGNALFNKNIKISLEKLGFPINEKAIFIN